MNHLDIELQGIDKEGKIKTYKLNNFKGNNLIVYFYPQDDTPVCTQEANDFKEALNELEKYVTIIGVSSNNLEDHIEFHNKHNLNFILFSDTENKLKHAFEEHDKYTQNIHRATFILDQNGNIIKYWVKVDIDGHIAKISEYLKNIFN
ncbi:MAG: peroxiredoxin [Candidatus Gastranaerophilales bacterium]|nr:peroxiredoxin [Candidatus Gastranaerophilales bacterium]